MERSIGLFSAFFAMQFVEDLDHIDELHHKPPIRKDTAINVVALLDLQILAGFEGEGRYAGDGDRQRYILAPDPAFELEILAVQLQDALTYFKELLFVVVNHMNFGFGS